MIDVPVVEQENPALEILKSRYFELAIKEKYPNTPKISEELDVIEAAISAITGKKLEKCSDRESVKIDIAP